MKTILSILLGAGMLLGATPASADSGDLGLPAYPSGRQIRMDGELSTNNIPLEASTFQTRDDIRTVMAYYQRELRKQGLTVVAHVFSINRAYVGYFDADSGTMRLATVLANPATHGSMVVLSSMDPRPLLDSQLQVPEGLPSVPGAHNVVYNTSMERRTESKTITFRAPGAMSAVRTSLLQSAESQGWKMDTRARNIPGAITLKRGGGTCMIRLVDDNSDPKQAAVLVNMLVMTPAAASPRSR